MSKRINVYIRNKTYELLEEYCKIEELDKSRAIDDILQFRLKYLEEERAKAEKKQIKELTGTMKEEPVKPLENETFEQYVNRVTGFWLNELSEKQLKMLKKWYEKE